MNNEGDFFIGNKRVSSSTGQEKTFDAPVPTVTGEDPSRLSVVFDEVVIKERLKVEGGTSRTILSNFDGPVNFSKDVRFDAITNFSKTLTLSQGTQSQSVTSGDLVVAGGVGIGKSVYIGGDLNVTGTVLGGNLQFGNIRVAETLHKHNHLLIYNSSKTFNEIVFMQKKFNTSFPFISMLSKVKMVISKIGRLKGVSMSFKSISVADAAQPIKNGVLVIDVREQNEYDQAHIENSVLVPLSTVSAEKINEINPQNKTILIHCHAGKRSKVAANIILSQGYAGEILELDEGISAWIEFGQKIIS